MQRLIALSLAASCMLGQASMGNNLHKDGLKVQRTLIATSEGHENALVHWEPWTDNLFARAQKENKLVVLDLEAIWCHWCHVMEKKTYSNPEIARELKEHYITVKVDQDSRPDLANRYEDYGWPATIFFSPKGDELAKRQGFIEPDEMLSLLKSLSKNPVPEEAKSSRQIEYSKNAALSAELRKELSGNNKKYYDSKEGGWQTTHKFLDFDSMEYALTLAKVGDAQEAQMAKQTLSAQLNLLDPVWGGVYQYSTGGDWKHPHFEKIMSVQGDNLRIYSLGYLYFNDPRFLKAAESIETYLRAFLMSPQGAFYTSQDADVKQGQHSGEYFKLQDAARRKQGIPRIDKHIYSRENGWAINGITSLYMATDNPKYLAEAEKAADYILKNRSLPGGGFKHEAEDAAGPYLGDSLFMGRALLSLYQATGNRKWLQKAEAAADFINNHFKSESGKAGFLTADASRAKLQKPEPLLDENIALARFANLLSQYSGKSEYREIAVNCMRYLATPEVAHTRKMLIAGILLCDRELSNPPAHITIVGSKKDPAAKALFQAANRYPLSYKRVEWYDAKEGKMPNSDTELPEMPKAAAFSCANQRCSRPVFAANEVVSLIDRTLKSH